jgi:hypothetical protein
MAAALSPRERIAATVVGAEEIGRLSAEAVQQQYEQTAQDIEAMGCSRLLRLWK